MELPPSALHSFADWGASNPCSGCPAPCCRMQIAPHPPPQSFSDLDLVRFLLLFPHTEVIVATTGDWSVVRWANCGELDDACAICRVHGTPAQPRICATFNPYSCWYKRNFVAGGTPDVYRLDLARFDRWVAAIGLDHEGRITVAPSFEESQELLAEIPISPILEMDPALAKPPVEAPGPTCDGP